MQSISCMFLKSGQFTWKSVQDEIIMPQLLTNQQEENNASVYLWKTFVLPNHIEIKSRVGKGSQIYQSLITY